MSNKARQVVNSSLPVMPILIPIGVHFILVSLVLLSNFLPAYLYVHLILILVGLWACHDKSSVLAAVSVIVVVLVAAVLDIVQLGLYFPAYQAQHGKGQTEEDHTWQIAAAMTVFNLLFKPITVVLVSVSVYVRAGGTLPGRLGGGQERGGYNRIPDSPQHEN
ncbi:uncharacterized protein LOC135334120 [Halichondria panicea]|uniref:uncharacterized protein LOC135334120 n=1 Tax=Halichondria panicea TaxID=6063 RepID=UPI00312B9080